MDDIKKEPVKKGVHLFKISSKEVIKFSQDFTHIQIELLILYPYLRVP